MSEVRMRWILALALVVGCSETEEAPSPTAQDTAAADDVPLDDAGADIVGADTSVDDGSLTFGQPGPIAGEAGRGSADQ